MLQLAATPAPKPTASHSAGVSARQVQNEAAGFHFELRHARDSAPEEHRQASRVEVAESKNREKAESVTVTPPNEDVRPTPTAPGATAAATQAGGREALQAEAANETAVPPAGVAVGTSEHEENAGQMAETRADMPAGPAVPHLAVIVMAAQPLAAPPGAADQLGITGSGQPARPAAVMITGENGDGQGLVSPMTDLSAVAIFATAGTAQATQSGPKMAETLVANTTLTQAEGVPVATQQPGVQPEIPMRQQGMELKATPDTAADQQHSLINALAAGPAQAAAQMAPSPHPTGAPPKPGPMVRAKEALETAKNTEALTLLAKAINMAEAAAEVKLVTAPETVAVSTHLASLEAPKSSNAKAFGEGRVDGLAIAPPGFVPADGMLQRSEAPAPASVARELPAPPPARQLAPVVVSLALRRGDEPLTIALDPGELGRVEVSIGQGKEAGQVRIVAERPETLALLQRDQRDLDRALNQAGLGDMARSLSFSLASDQGRQQQQGSSPERGHRPAMIVGGLDGGHAMPAPEVRNRNATSLIDIAV